MYTAKKIFQGLTIAQRNNIKACYSLNDTHKVNFKVTTESQRVQVITDICKIFKEQNFKLLVLSSENSLLNNVRNHVTTLESAK